WGGKVIGETDARALAVFVADGGDLAGPAAERHAAARGAALLVDDLRHVCNHDVAFVVLDRPLAVRPSTLRLGPPSAGERLDVVGWGRDGTGRLPRVRRTRRGVALLGIGPALYPTSATYGYGDHEFLLGESACLGDSGGA